MSATVLTMRSITEDAFAERFGPRPNHLDLSAGFDWGDGGCLLNTTGKEFRYVLAQNPLTVWTVLAGDVGQLAIESGLHFVNRLGYIVTTHPIEYGTNYSVMLD